MRRDLRQVITGLVSILCRIGQQCGYGFYGNVSDIALPPRAYDAPTQRHNIKAYIDRPVVYWKVKLVEDE